jgi:hypothetical protein
MLLDRGLMVRRRFPVAKIEDSSSSGVVFFWALLRDSLPPLRSIQAFLTRRLTTSLAFPKDAANLIIGFWKLPNLLLWRSLTALAMCCVSRKRLWKRRMIESKGDG